MLKSNKSILKIELTSAFNYKGLYLAKCIRMVIAVVHIVQVIYPFASTLDAYIELNYPTLYPGALWSNWIGGRMRTAMS